MERVEKQKQLSHSFHRPLGISQTARDPHISTARFATAALPSNQKKTKTKMMIRSEACRPRVQSQRG